MIPLITLLIIALAASNFYLQYDANFDFVVNSAGDIISYRVIALAAPHLPPAGSDLFFHHSQRLFTPYIIGLLKFIVPIPIDYIFLTFTLALLFLSAAVMDACLRKIGSTTAIRFLFLLVYLLNPYVSRYYIGIPMMVTDVGFGFGLICTMYGLVSNRYPLTLAAVIFASLNRQTALMIAPLIALAEFNGLFGKRQGYLKSSAIIAFPLGIYVFTGLLVKAFSMPSRNFSTVSGLLVWLNNSPKLLQLGEFVLRGFFPFFTATAVFFAVADLDAFKKIDKRSIFFLIISLAVCAQPFLGGPGVTGQSITRLNSLSLAPLLIAFGSILISLNKIRIDAFQLSSVACLLALGSMHHIYSYNGALSSDRSVRFFILFLTVSALVFSVLRFGTFLSGNTSGPQERNV